MTETSAPAAPAPAAVDIELMHPGAITGCLHYGPRAACTLTGCTAPVAEADDEEIMPCGHESGFCYC